MEESAWLENSRTPEGRESLREAGHLQILLTYHRDISTSWQIRYKYLQCMKNCVINCSKNGLFLLEEGALDLIIQHLIQLEEMKDEEITPSYCRLSLQFLTNLLTSYPPCIDVFWSRYGLDFLSRFLSLSVSLKSDASVAATIAIIHCCISKDDQSYSNRRNQFLEGLRFHSLLSCD